MLVEAGEDCTKSFFHAETPAAAATLLILGS
jgi:hypothetical protein